MIYVIKHQLIKQKESITPKTSHDCVLIKQHTLDNIDRENIYKNIYVYEPPFGVGE